MTSGLEHIRRAWRRRARTAGVATMAVTTLLLTGCGNAGSGAAIAPRMMSIGSEAFSQNILPAQYTCHGGRNWPPLDWSGAPAGTKSIAIVEGQHRLAHHGDRVGRHRVVGPPGEVGYRVGQRRSDRVHLP